MSDWLDALVSKTQQQFEQQRTKEAKFLERAKLKTALGEVFFGDLKKWLKENSDKFNRKIEKDVFSVDLNGPRNSVTVRSCPDLTNTWTATLTYTANAYRIEINRSPGGTESYSLDLTADGSRIVALRGNRTNKDNGLSAEMVCQNIMTSMLLPS